MSWDVLLIVTAMWVATRLPGEGRLALAISLVLVATPVVLFMAFVVKWP